MATTVTSKGQVTLPKRLRDRLGIQPGSRVEFELAEDGRVFLTKAAGTRPKSPLEALRGRAARALAPTKSWP